MNSTPATAVLEIVRTFNAPRQLVFNAFASFEAMKRWMGPATCEVTGGCLDFKIGGEYRFDMKTPMGTASVAGRYVEIAPPDRIAFTWSWLDDEEWEPVDSLVVCEFKEVGQATELRLVHTGFPSLESRNRHQEGWCGSLDKLTPGGA